jgi:hypothetical protein
MIGREALTIGDRGDGVVFRYCSINDAPIVEIWKLSVRIKKKVDLATRSTFFFVYILVCCVRLSCIYCREQL